MDGLVLVGDARGGGGGRGARGGLVSLGGSSAERAPTFMEIEERVWTGIFAVVHVVACFDREVEEERQMISLPLLEVQINAGAARIVVLFGWKHTCFEGNV